MIRSSQTWALISLGASLNLALGTLVAALKFPIYLDSAGTILVGMVAGPLAGAVTGAVSIMVLALSSPSALPFLPVACLIGIVVGVIRGLVTSPSRLLLTGLGLGVISAAASAPIATVVFGGVTGGGTDLLVALFRASGRSALEAAFLQSLTVDPVDKLVSLILAVHLVRSVPARALVGFGSLPGWLATAPSGGDRAYQAQPDMSRKETRPAALPPENTTELYMESGLLSRAGAGLKLVCLIVVVAVSLWVDSCWQAFSVLVAVALALLLSGPVQTRKALRLSAPILLPLGVSVSLVQGFFGPKPSKEILWSLEGLELAGLLWCRVGLLVFVSFSYLLSTPLERLSEVLVAARVPYPLVFTVVTGVNLVPRFRAHLHQSILAAQSRGMDWGQGGVARRWKQFQAVLAPALHTLFSELPGRSAALESRGFHQSGRPTSTPLTWRRGPKPTASGDLFCLALVALACGVAWWTSH